MTPWWAGFAAGVMVGVGLVAASAIAVILRGVDRAMTPEESTWIR